MQAEIITVNTGGKLVVKPGTVGEVCTICGYLGGRGVGCSRDVGSAHPFYGLAR